MSYLRMDFTAESQCVLMHIKSIKRALEYLYDLQENPEIAKTSSNHLNQYNQQSRILDNFQLKGLE